MRVRFCSFNSTLKDSAALPSGARRALLIQEIMFILHLASKSMSLRPPSLMDCIKEPETYQSLSLSCRQFCYFCLTRGRSQSFDFHEDSRRGNRICNDVLQERQHQCANRALLLLYRPLTGFTDMSFFHICPFIGSMVQKCHQQFSYDSRGPLDSQFNATKSNRTLTLKPVQCYIARWHRHSGGVFNGRLIISFYNKIAQ